LVELKLRSKLETLILQI